MARILARADIVKSRRPTSRTWASDVAAPVVVVTDAGGPVRVRLGDEEHEVAVPAVEVVDTVGAGDTFGGAMLAWLVHAGMTRATSADRAVVLPAVRFGRPRRIDGRPAPRRRPADPRRARRLVGATHARRTSVTKCQY